MRAGKSPRRLNALSRRSRVRTRPAGLLNPCLSEAVRLGAHVTISFGFARSLAVRAAPLSGLDICRSMDVSNLNQAAFPELDPWALIR